MGFLCVLLLCLILNSNTLANKEDNVLSLAVLHYKTVGELLANGKKCDSYGRIGCDPLFEVCLTDEYTQNTCKLLHMKETTGRKEVNELIFPHDLSWSFTLHKVVSATKYILWITVHEYDVVAMYGYSRIAKFKAQFPFKPSYNDTPPIVRNISMVRVEENPGNDVTLSVQVKAKCGLHRYGLNCNVECIPRINRSTCSNNGEEICLSGWMGENCAKEDFCYYEKCANNAQCVNLPSGEGKECQCNGGSGPECYPNYNQCESNPCQNGGACSMAGIYNETYECECPWLWQGRQCQDRVDVCQSSPCANGGTCFASSDGVIKCHCLEGFLGHLCNVTAAVPAVPQTGSPRLMQYKIITAATAIAFCIIAAGVIGFSVYFFYFRKKSKKRSNRAANVELSAHPVARDNEFYDQIDPYEVPENNYTVAPRTAFSSDEYDNCDEYNASQAPTETTYIGGSGSFGSQVSQGTSLISPNGRTFSMSEETEFRPPLPRRSPNSPGRRTPKMFVRALSSGK